MIVYRVVNDINVTKIEDESEYVHLGLSLGLVATGLDWVKADR